MTEVHSSWKKYLFIATLIITLVSTAWHIYMNLSVQNYGLTFDIDEDGQITVASVASGSDAFTKGIAPGDIVHSVMGSYFEDVEEDPMEFLAEQLRGDYLEIGIDRGDGETKVFLEPNNPGLTLHYSLVLFVALLYIIMGVWVFFARPNYQAANAWGFFSVLMSGLALTIGSTSSGSEFFGVVLSVIVVAQILYGISAGIHFSLVFPRVGPIARQRWSLPIIYIIPTILLLLITTMVVIIETRGFSNLADQIITVLNICLAILFSTYLLMMIGQLLLTYARTEDRNERQRIRVIIFGTALPLGAVLISVVYEMFFPVENEEAVQTFLLLALAVVPFTYLYAIVRYRAMQMQLILKRGLIYSMLTGTLVIMAGTIFLLFFGLMLLFQDVLPGALGREGGTFYEMASDQNVQKFFIAVMSVLIGATVGSLKRRVQTTVDRLFYRGRYSYQQAVENISEVIRQTHDIDHMMDMVVKTSEEIVHPQNTSIVILDDKQRGTARRALPQELEGIALDSEEVKTLVTHFSDDRLYISRRDLNEEQFKGGALISQTLSQLRADIILPLKLRTQNKILGFMALGKKRSETSYDLEEIKLLNLLAEQAALSLEHISLATEAAEKQKLKRDLAIGRMMQERMLPREIPEIPGVQLAALNIPAREVSGDFYTFITSRQPQLGLIVGDIVGKGVAGALNMAAIISTLVFIAGETDSISQALHRLNRYLVENWPKRSFAAITYAQADPEQMTFSWCSGGLPDPVYIPREGSPRYLEQENYPLPPGSSANSEFSEQQIQCQPGDTILLLTDGAIEAAAPEDGRMIGFEGMLELCESLRDHQPGDFLDAMAAHIHKFSGSALLDDDLTAVVLRFDRPDDQRSST